MQEEQGGLWKYYKKIRNHIQETDNFKHCGFYFVWNVKKKLWEKSDEYGVVSVLNRLLL